MNPITPSLVRGLIYNYCPGPERYIGAEGDSIASEATAGKLDRRERKSCSLFSGKEMTPVGDGDDLGCKDWSPILFFQREEPHLSLTSDSLISPHFSSCVSH